MTILESEECKKKEMKRSLVTWNVIEALYKEEQS